MKHLSTIRGRRAGYQPALRIPHTKRLKKPDAWPTTRERWQFCLGASSRLTPALSGSDLETEDMRDPPRRRR